MSKGSKTKIPANSQTNKTPKSGNSLEKYFGSPVDSDSTKKRKMSTLDLSGDSGSPPAKKMDKDKETAPVDGGTPPTIYKTRNVLLPVRKYVST